MRTLALLAGIAVGGVMMWFGLLVAVRILLPDWYAVPIALLHMTNQKVPVAAPPSSPGAGVAECVPTPGHVVPSGQPTPAALDGGPVDTISAPQAVPIEPVAADTPTAEPQGSDGLGTLLPSRRFNVLLLGSDNDLKFSTDAVLTQSMILVSIDPRTAEVAMISIPRDFWVPIAGYGSQKIDVAYEVGGIALARSTVEKLFGIKIDYYAWVGLNGLIQVIDTLGGVDVTVQHPILDEVYPDDLNSGDPYAFFRLYIPAGPQHLDGTTALEYVRSRHGDLQSDFGRSTRQQQVLLAMKNRVQTVAVVTQVPQLVTDLQGSVKTDLSLPAVLQLAALARKIPPGAIRQQVLSAPEFASLGYSPDGAEQVVYPDWAAIRPAVARLLQSSPLTTSAASGT